MKLFGYTLTEILAFIGALTILFSFIKLLFELIPHFGWLKTSVYKSLATKIKHRNLEKRAIASNIENVVNESVSHLQGELPLGWVSKARIEWVKEEKQEDLDEDQLILRIRPIEDQDRNLINGIYYYFVKAVFPKVRQIIPMQPKKAAILQLSKRTVTKYHPYSIGLFEDHYLEPAIQKDGNIVHYLDNYETMDNYGFFTSVYLREATEVADKVRFTEQRMEIAAELDGIMAHIATFIKGIKKNPDIPDELWVRKAETYSYAFLLVARPVFRRKVNTYVSKANKHISNRIEKLYVIGADKEKSFVRKVVSAITRWTAYDLSEEFELYKDYRGEPGGVCAMFQIPSHLLQRKEKKIED